ncbi:MAG: helix-turn-helix transcriptional regulator [Ruminococcaceae bacterium]|nr:helix-turn-helix transcriptional regulator [Oscillospiraceae bacterium]
MIDFVKVGARISEHRKRMGLSQEELAEKLYVTRQAISKWENGTSVPSIDTLCEISKMFKVSFEEILGLFDNEKIEVDKSNIFIGHDRSFIVSKIASGEIKVKLDEVFYQMSPAERMYILKHIKEGLLKARIDELWVKLTPSEQKFLGGMVPYEA